MNHIQALNEALNEHFSYDDNGTCQCLRCLSLRDLKRQLEKCESPISKLNIKDGRLTCH